MQNRYGVMKNNLMLWLNKMSFKVYFDARIFLGLEYMSQNIVQVLKSLKFIKFWIYFVVLFLDFNKIDKQHVENS